MYFFLQDENFLKIFIYFSKLQKNKRDDFEFLQASKTQKM